MQTLRRSIVATGGRYFNIIKLIRYWLDDIICDIINQKEEPYEIIRDGEGFIIKGDEVERLFKMTKFSSEEGMLRFARSLRRMGIDDKLESMGAKEGDIVKILDFSFEYRK